MLNGQKYSMSFYTVWFFFFIQPLILLLVYFRYLLFVLPIQLLLLTVIQKILTIKNVIDDVSKLWYDVIKLKINYEG